MLTASIFKNGECKCCISSNINDFELDYPEIYIFSPRLVSYVKQFLRYENTSCFYFLSQPHWILQNMVEALKSQVASIKILK